MSFSALSAGAEDAEKCVFSDAALWIKGAYDRNDTAGLDSKDMKHAFSAGNNLTVSYWGGDENCVRRYESVECPYANTVMTNVPCIYIPRKVDAEGYTHPRHFLFKNAVSVTNCKSTVVMRLRPEYGASGSTWVCGALGFQVGFLYNADDETFTLRGYCGNWQVANYKIKPGTWMDLAVVGGDNVLKFYAITNGGTLFYQARNASGTETAGIKTEVSLGLHQSGYSSWNPVSVTGSNQRYQAFCGSIQQFAVWNRQLSAAEIREAFAFPRSDIMRIGIANGSSGEFIEESNDEAKVNADDWHTMPSVLNPGEQIDIAFLLREFESALPQVLRLSSLEGTSADAELSVSINEAAVPEKLYARPGKTSTLYIPGSMFCAGSNILHIANDSSGVVKIDALAMGGSWQVGHADNTYSEFTLSDVFDWDAQCGAWTGFHRTTDSGATNTVTMVLTREFVEQSYPAFLTVSAYTSYGLQHITPTPVCELIVNGASRGIKEFKNQYEVFTTRIRPEELRVGSNVFAFVNHLPQGTSKGWICMDYWRLEVKDCLKSTVILVR